MTKSDCTIGFDRSEGRCLFKNLVRYDESIHEIDRNLSLLRPLGIEPPVHVMPRVYPSVSDKRYIDSFLEGLSVGKTKGLVALAPGTVWNTKRWPKEKFAELCRQLSSYRYGSILIGGREDVALCGEIASLAKVEGVFNAAGRLSLLQSAELLRRCGLIIANDSAPVHLAMAVGTPVLVIFGATVPEFGFAPCGPRDVVVETIGLPCRPCSIHGGKKCPIGTFDCMRFISSERVLREALSILSA